VYDSSKCFYQLDCKTLLLNLTRKPSFPHCMWDMGSFRITKRLGPIVYHLSLASYLDHMHDVFYVSILCHYLLEPSHVMCLSNL
jgi:hypothetical protein